METVLNGTEGKVEDKNHLKEEKRVTKEWYPDWLWGAEGLRIRVHSYSSDLGFVIYWNLIWDESIALLSLSLHLEVIHLLSSWVMWLLKSIICHLAFRSSYRLSPLAGPLFSLATLHSHSKTPHL